jgi:hypothetical protein
MTYRTLLLSSIEHYMAREDDPLADRLQQSRERDERLRQFPFPVMLEFAYPELDFAIRWCWQRFGPMDGDCTQKSSEYRICCDETPHRHAGTWTTHWFVKTEYNFGFCEWYFSNQADHHEFRASLPELNWGELYPKHRSTIGDDGRTIG